MNLVLGLACLRTGILLELYGADGDALAAEMLAASVPRLFESAQMPDWNTIFERLGGSAASGFQDLLLVTDDTVHFVQRLQSPLDTALVAVAEGTTNVGLVLASVRKKAAELERA